MQVPWVICFLFVFFNRCAECTNCSAIKVPHVEMEYWLSLKTEVTWNTIPNATYTITACCLRKGMCMRVADCPSTTLLHDCHDGPRKSTRTCVVSQSTTVHTTIRVTMSIKVPGCPTKSANISLRTKWEGIRAKPVHGLSLTLQPDGVLAKWSHGKPNLCYFYRAVEVSSKVVPSLIKEGKLPDIQNVKVRLDAGVLHGYRQIKFCVKLRYCPPTGIVGKMSEEKCVFMKTPPGAPSKSVTMLCDGGRGPNPCPVVKNKRERNITLLWELPEERFWNGILTKIEIFVNNSVYTTINATRTNYTLTGLKLNEDCHIQLKLFSHSGEGRKASEMLFSKEKVSPPVPNIPEDEVDSAILIIIVAACLVVAITVVFVFTFLTIRSKRKQKSPLPNIQMPGQGEAHSGTDPNLRTSPANYESLPESEDVLGDKSSVEKLSCNSSENDSITCPLVANTSNGICCKDATCYPKETCI